ncbi:unnamed protein product [Microthlaspi erraticum]|uniref:Uncharacterized protein n=1 Tax=Microthlaspi erraticum TaxID=1685480 RepID=A0A6D2HGR4_9BRAS|nr:unnamed protein product [Microthlaspi erraticum]
MRKKFGRLVGSSVVRFEHSAAEMTHDGLPSFAVKGDSTKSSGGPHVRHHSSSSAPRAYSGCRLPPPDLLPLVFKLNRAVLGVIQPCGSPPRVTYRYSCLADFLFSR